ncbi:hypothetical protein SUGI_0773490 [Cryptomeria japonica]|nr:hypothetical protein SUGI_0773490 [Cryptomeria japonica]
MEVAATEEHLIKGRLWKMLRALVFLSKRDRVTVLGLENTNSHPPIALHSQINSQDQGNPCNFPAFEEVDAQTYNMGDGEELDLSVTVRRDAR